MKRSATLTICLLLVLFDAELSQAQKPELVVQTGHSDRLDSVAFSPDGNTLASLSNDKTIKLWDVSSGAVLRTLKRNSEFGFLLRFNPDGRILVSDGGDQTLELWDVSTGTLLRSLPGYSVSSTAFSQDSKTLAGVGSDHFIKIWDAATGTVLRSFKSDSVSSIAFSPDGKVLAGGGADGIIKLWEVSSGAELRTLKGIVSRDKPEFSATVERMPEVYYSLRDTGFWPAAGGRVGLQHVAAPAGHEFAVMHLEVKPPPGMHHFLIKDPVLYDTAGRKYSSFVLTELMLSRLSQQRKTDFAFEVPQGVQLQSLKFENYSFDLATQILSVEPAPHRVRELHRQDNSVTSLAFSPDGKMLASGGSFLVKLWDVSSGVELNALEGNPWWIQSITFSPNGKNLFVFSGRDPSVVQWDVSTGAQLAVLNANAIVFRDGRVLTAAIVFNTQEIKLNDLLAGAELRTLKQHVNRVRSIALSSDGTTFASGGDDVKLWSLATGGAVRSLKENQSFVVAFSPDGKTVASGNSNGTIELFNVISGTLLRSLSENSIENSSTATLSIAFSPDNKTLAGVREGVVLWKVATGETIRTIELVGTEPICVAFSPDGKTLAIGTGLEGDEVFGVELRRVSTGKLLRRLGGHAASVQSVTFSPDGKTVASGSWDGTVNLWNVATGTRLRTIKRSSSSALVFSPDGNILASDDRSTVKLWSVKAGKELRTLNGHIDSVSSISFSSDGKYLLSGSSDASVKLWDARSGKELATLIALDEPDWLIVTPEGLFDGSPGAWNKIIWRFNNNTFNYAPVEAFYNEFYYPGLLADIFAGKHPKAPSDISQKDRRQPQLKLTLADMRPGETIGSRNVPVKIDVAALAADKDNTSDSGAQDVRLFRNGSLVKVWRGDVLKGKSTATLETTIPIIAGENTLTAYAFNHDNIKSSDATLVVNGADTLKRAGTLYVLGIGSNEYQSKGYDLKFALADVEEMSKQVKSFQDKLGTYAQTEIIALENQEATKANIMLALERFGNDSRAKIPDDAPAALRRELDKIKPLEPEDALVIYYAGHGTAIGQHFYLLPHDFLAGSEAELKASSIADSEINEVLERVDAGKLLMVIDACQSGQALGGEKEGSGPMNSKGLAQLAYDKGMYILTAAQSYQAALEVSRSQVSQKIEHGLLTFALLEGLNKAKRDNDGQISEREWMNYAVEQVPLMQTEEMKKRNLENTTYRGAGKRGTEIVFDENDKETDPEKRNVQRPRVFYRRELEVHPLIVARQ